MSRYKPRTFLTRGPRDASLEDVDKYVLKLPTRDHIVKQAQRLALSGPLQPVLRGTHLTERFNGAVPSDAGIKAYFRANNQLQFQDALTLLMYYHPEHVAVLARAQSWPKRAELAGFMFGEVVAECGLLREAFLLLNTGLLKTDAPKSPGVRFDTVVQPTAYLRGAAYFGNPTMRLQLDSITEHSSGPPADHWAMITFDHIPYESDTVQNFARYDPDNVRGVSVCDVPTARTLEDLEVRTSDGGPLDARGHVRQRWYSNLYQSRRKHCELGYDELLQMPRSAFLSAHEAQKLLRNHKIH